MNGFARAASGHAIALPRIVMNSRRFIALTPNSRWEYSMWGCASQQKRPAHVRFGSLTTEEIEAARPVYVRFAPKSGQTVDRLGMSA
jgi:hypothetical protein